MGEILTAAELAMRRAGTAPFKTVDRGTTYGYNNTLIEAATPSTDREQTTLVDYDIHRTISVQGRRLLLSMARTVFWRFPALHGSVLEQANLAVSTYTPRFGGKNKDWGDRGTTWLHDWHQVFDLAGWPYDDETYRELLIISCIIDGEMGTLLTEDGSGNPRIQIIPSHRIGSRYQTGGSARVRYAGNQMFIDDVLVDDSLPFQFSTPVEWVAPITDGVIVDGQARALAYRVYDDPAVSSQYRDFSARDMFLSFIPMFPGQLRGISLLASSVFPWEDVHEWRKFEMLAHKVFSGQTIVEENETGDIDASKQLVAGPQFTPAAVDADGKAIPQQLVAPAMVKIEGGAYRIFKSKTGSKLTPFETNRTSPNTTAFMEMTVRDAFRGTEWDAFFSLDPKSVGGAPMRVIVDKINRTLKKRRRLPHKAMRRIDVYGLAKGALRTGELPMDPDWFRWHYQGPQDITADRRYESQTDLEEYEAGWMNLEDIEKKRNGDWQGKRAQRTVEVRDKFKRAKEIADEFGVSIQEVMLEFGKIGQASFSHTDQEKDNPEGETQPGKSRSRKGAAEEDDK
jgi:hypothetical protein